jgi:hypothetical protein
MNYRSHFDSFSGEHKTKKLLFKSTALFYFTKIQDSSIVYPYYIKWPTSLSTNSKEREKEAQSLKLYLVNKVRK